MEEKAEEEGEDEGEVAGKEEEVDGEAGSGGDEIAAVIVLLRTRVWCIWVIAEVRVSIQVFLSAGVPQ